MAQIVKARAYANNEVAIIAWDVDEPIPGCRGFEITRICLDPPGEERVLPAWVPFTGQSNPDWKPQTTSVWPVQKLMWRDLTPRKRRDQTDRRPGDLRVKYRVRAVVEARPGLPPVPGSDQPFGGEPAPLCYLGEGLVTEPVEITGDYDELKVAFTNGILSAQWLTHALEELGQEPTTAILRKHIADAKDKLRAYLAGDVLGLLLSLLDRASKEPGAEVRMALYELSDEQLVDAIIANRGRVRLILSNSSADRKSKAWDAENATWRRKLTGARLLEMHNRMFNNSAHIGHNKFAVYCDSQKNPRAVLTGSTNWTPNGLCAQSNNAILIEDPEVAVIYDAYWQLIKTDTVSFAQPDPLSAGTNNKQGQPMRTTDAQPPRDTPLKRGLVRVWKSPNTKKVTKGPELPPDLANVYSLMRKAKELILFAVFLPARSGKDSIIEETLQIGEKDPSLLVYGAISDPTAMPNYVAPDRGGSSDDTSPSAKTPQPAIYDSGNVHVLRAAALGKDDLIGDFERELLKAGNAIIHDKIVVIDPLSSDCVVVTGSHNLGYKASYCNDENLLIFQGNQRLAQAYATHLIDLYDHYRFRAVQADMIAQSRKSWSGFLARNDQWLRSSAGTSRALAEYLARGQ